MKEETTVIIVELDWNAERSMAHVQIGWKGKQVYGLSSAIGFTSHSNWHGCCMMNFAYVWFDLNYNAADVKIGIKHLKMVPVD